MPTGEEDKRNAKKEEWCLSDYALGAAVGAAAVAATPLVLSAAGFTAAGVAGGSAAAGIQSAVYGGAVGSGSVFAVLQSAGAAGVGWGAKVAISAAVCRAATYIKSKVAPCHGEPCSSDGNDS